MKGLLPIILIVVAIGLFFMQVNPLYSEVKQLRVEAGQYNDALTMAQELADLRISLKQKLDSFPEQNMQRIDHFLPRRLDTVRIILDIDALAARNGIRLTDFVVSEPNSSAKKGNAKSTSSSSSYSTVGVAFNFTSSYAGAVQFIREMQKSLRILDIVDFNVSPSESIPGQYDFSVNINTYWINR